MGKLIESSTRKRLPRIHILTALALSARELNEPTHGSSFGFAYLVVIAKTDHKLDGVYDLYAL